MSLPVRQTISLHFKTFCVFMSFPSMWKILSYKKLCTAGSQGRDSSGNYQGMLLAGLLHDSCLASLLIQPRTAWPGNGTTQGELGLPKSINNQDNPTHTHMLIGRSDRGSSQLRQVVPCYVKLTVEATYTQVNTLRLGKMNPASLRIFCQVLCPSKEPRNQYPLHASQLQTTQ